jgi:adenylate cyclase
MHRRYTPRITLGTSPVSVPTVPFPRTMERQIADIMAQAAPRRDAVGVDRRTVSVLFVRIDGYVSLCEELEPPDVGSILAIYMGTVIDTVSTFAGTVQGSLGDTVVATWNAVHPHPDHALLAVNAAIEMVERTGDVNARLPEHLPEIRYAVGVNTGDALVQRTGARRGDHQVIGDSVNIAHLLSFMSSDGCILMGEGTRISTEGDILAEDAGILTLPGRTKPVRAFAVQGRKPFDFTL